MGVETATQIVKCPCCGKFVAKISGVSAEVTLNCKTTRCGSELRIEFSNGAVVVSVVGKSNQYSPMKR
jgi:hypothetical protein